jgi:hypothetical protein
MITAQELIELADKKNYGCNITLHATQVSTVQLWSIPQKEWIPTFTIELKDSDWDRLLFRTKIFFETGLIVLEPDRCPDCASTMEYVSRLDDPEDKHMVCSHCGYMT